MQLRSDAVKVGVARAPHRSLLKADGLTDEEMKKPLVAVFNSRNDIIPGHNNLDKICEAVRPAFIWPVAFRSKFPPSACATALP